MAGLTVTAPGEFRDPDLKPLMDGYRQVVAQRYTACAPTDLGRLLAAPPYRVSRKVDGELWFVVATATGPTLVAANGRVATGLSPILEAAVALPPGTVIAGELHAPGAGAGNRERVGDVAAALGQGGQALHFGAFDLVRDSETTWRDTTYVDRLDRLRGLLPADGAAHVIAVTTVEAEADVIGLYADEVTGKGAEGLVVRCTDGRALKVKPEITVDVAVLGFTAREGSAGPEVRSLLIGVASGSNAWVPLATVGTLVDCVDRRDLLARLSALETASKYRRASSTGQLYTMVEPSMLLECRVLDVQVEDSRERPVRQPELERLDGTWTVRGQVRAATLINPIVIRLRDDKPDVREGARWAQIEPYVPVPTEGETLETAQVIRRQVWTKTGKDKTDVRKLVVWKTNKDTVDPTYPAYVVHWTDYSAGRKTPLTREVRPVASEAAAEAAAEALIADNIKKGWDLHA